MRTPKISTKRVLGLTMAAALAVTATVAIAGSSEAAVTVQALKLSPVTGSSAGGTIVTVAGTGFESAAGASKIGKVFFSTTTCAAAASPSNTATVTSLVSATKIVLTTPALALTASKPTAWNLCVDNTANDAVLGTAKFTSYAAPYTNTLALSASTGASYGGDTLTITGENFTTKTTATVGGKTLVGAKVVIGTGTTASGNSGDDTLTGTVPAGAGTGKAVVVTSEGGSITAATAFDYLDAVKVVAPAYGDGTANSVITLTGTGFSTRVFGAAIDDSAVGLVAAGTSIAAAASVPTTGLCGSVQVVSDTELNCQLTAAITAKGAYSAVIFTRDHTDATKIATAGATAVSRSATYTISAF
jgi:hypothetical protein